MLSLLFWSVLIANLQVFEVNLQTLPFNCDLHYDRVPQELAELFCGPRNTTPISKLDGCIQQEGNLCLECDTGYYLDGSGKCLDIYFILR